MGEIGDLKRIAAYEAVDSNVRSGMTVGLGTGSTASHAVRRVGELLSGGELSGVRGIPTSERTAALAAEVGIPLVTLAEARPDLTIDGADEISPSLDVIKGYGGALLREKIVAASGREGLVIVADASKLKDPLGDGPLPVEVEPFGWQATFDALASLGCEPKLRTDSQDPSRPFVTDGGHYTVDCLFPSITEPAALETEIKRIPGALECGLFVGIAYAAYVAHEDRTEVLEA
ncbi:MAG TPA: ribose-5-phosphate isomerase RpiA [Rubrobacteraceae bacterium]|nr:ribose-5-phosphate isomerase RpiA [Rubrobacteraceae bacterium]